MTRSGVILVSLITLMALVSLAGTIHTYSQAQGAPAGAGWGIFNIKSPSLAVYDYDMDGFPEVVVSPNKVIDGKIAVEGPYEGLSNLTRVGKYLVSYGPSGVKVYQGENLVYSDSIPRDVHFDLEYQAAIIGTRMVYNDITPVNPPLGRYVFTVYNFKPVYLYYNSGSRSIHVKYGSTDVDLGINAEPLAVYVTADTLYGLVAPSSGLLFIKVLGITNSTYQATGIDLSSDSVPVGFDLTRLSFLVYSNGIIYLAGDKGLISLLTGVPLCVDGKDVYLLTTEGVRVYNTVLGLVTKEYPSPPIEPQSASCKNGVIAVSNGSSITVFYPYREPIVSVYAPRTAYVYEPVNYHVDYRHADNVVVVVNSTLKPAAGSIVFNASGKYNITAIASNMFYQKKVNAEIIVLPRPLKTNIHAYGVPVAYHNFTFSVESFDSLDNSKAYMTCKADIPGIGLISIKSWDNITIPVKPPSNGPFTIKVYCGDGVKYDRSLVSLSMPVKPVSTRLIVDYIGNATVKLSITDTEGILVPGTLSVRYVNTTLIGENPLVMFLIKGNHTARVSFTPIDKYYKPLNARVVLVYNSTVNEGKLRNYKIYVEQVIKNRTLTITQQLSVPVEKKVITMNTSLLVALVSISSVGGLVLGYTYMRYGLSTRLKALLVRLTKRKTGGEQDARGNEDSAPSSSVD